MNGCDNGFARTIAEAPASPAFELLIKQDLCSLGGSETRDRSIQLAFKKPEVTVLLPGLRQPGRVRSADAGGRVVPVTYGVQEIGVIS